MSFDFSVCVGRYFCYYLIMRNYVDLNHLGQAQPFLNLNLYLLFRMPSGCVGTKLLFLRFVWYFPYNYDIIFLIYSVLAPKYLLNI